MVNPILEKLIFLVMHSEILRITSNTYIRVAKDSNYFEHDFML